MLKGVAAGASSLALAAAGWAAKAEAATAPTTAVGRAGRTTPVVGGQGAASPVATTGTGTAATGAATASPVPGGLVGYAFNAKTQDVTLFDPATLRSIATEPLGVVVRWLANEQRFWDGRHVWTYDFPDDLVRAIAIDPWLPAVARTLPTDGAGPAHSLMLTPDRREAWVNVAGDDSLAVFDVASGERTARIETGAFP